MERKGFPESYDLRRLVGFLADLKSGKAEAKAPVYSHLTYDIVRGRYVTVRRPDILILEGLGVLHTGTAAPKGPRCLVGHPSISRSTLDADRAAHPEVFHRALPHVPRDRLPRSERRSSEVAVCRFAKRGDGEPGVDQHNGQNLPENILPKKKPRQFFPKGAITRRNGLRRRL
jgi:type I pantothenate kinase